MDSDVEGLPKDNLGSSILEKRAAAGKFNPIELLHQRITKTELLPWM